MTRDRYFDHAATTPVDPRVLAEMEPSLREEWGNAHSPHMLGQQARRAVERARERVASLLGAEFPEQIVFTSGATEANNWVLRSFPGAAIGPFEHSAVFEPAMSAGGRLLENDGYRIIPPSEPAELVSVMAVNNEFGARWRPAEFRASARLLHTDATQAVGKVPLDLEEVDYASLSAHKLYGPKGVGALYCRSEPPPPLLQGGGQESGARSGTLNVPGIVGLGAAAAIAEQERDENLQNARELRAIVLESLARCPDHLVLGGEEPSPYILGLAFLGVQGESLVIDLDAQGFAISAGAACSSGSTEASRVVRPLGLSTEWARGAVRVSFGKWNTREAARDLGKGLALSVERLRNLRTF